MSASQSVQAEPVCEEPFPGGELTVARAAKLLRGTEAEVEALVAAGAVEARRTPRPGGGEQLLVSLASIQAVRTAEPSSPLAPEPSTQAGPPDPAMVLARRPGAPVAPAEVVLRPGASPSAPSPASPTKTELLQLTQAVDRLTAKQGELLSKLEELIEVLRPPG